MNPAFTPSPQRYLTGITTTGAPHLGNFVGSIRPSVVASRLPGVQSFYFLADYHALIKCDEPARIQRSTLEIAASWLAAGLDPERVAFYRQSDIPEIAELTWLLTCVTGKGMLNRAHAYKASVDKNAAAGNDPDADVSAGLFMYPVLMGADILMFKSHKVPVGRDQIQHIEMARDMAQRFNHLYGEHLVMPEAVVEESVALLPGLDGRKMSKSYNNTIPLFAPRDQLSRLIAGIVTDSRTPREPKEVEGSALFQIYQAFASEPETTALRKAYADGIGWGDAKQLLFERIDREVAPMRQRYHELIGKPGSIETLLRAGAEKARAVATPFMNELRQAVGLRNLASQTSAPAKGKSLKSDVPAFKQYREKDGQYYFKLIDTDARPLLQSSGFDSPREAALVISTLQKDGLTALADQNGKVKIFEGVSTEALDAALKAFRVN
ncbi:tryptophan--tRNA ligase [Polaromonas sp.]|uniref:tryptophan--tRNA ligase n=1 Tax=Polaromonas sp. TaxID=1869339 RepID=UPI0017E5CF8E|nr:tryptophan--tRNA ligase [Polaromonas sp.]NML86701.1 tryptophan--tRNA ligase [Polaromonas sp.]